MLSRFALPSCIDPGLQSSKLCATEPAEDGLLPLSSSSPPSEGGATCVAVDHGRTYPSLTVKNS